MTARRSPLSWGRNGRYPGDVETEVCPAFGGQNPDELLRQLRRAISLLHGSVNLLSLAEDIFRWCREQDDLLNHRRRQQRPIEFIRIRWALDYYQAGDAE